MKAATVIAALLGIRAAIDTLIATLQDESGTVLGGSPRRSKPQSNDGPDRSPTPQSRQSGPQSNEAGLTPGLPSLLGSDLSKPAETTAENREIGPEDPEGIAVLRARERAVQAQSSAAVHAVQKRKGPPGPGPGGLWSEDDLARAMSCGWDGMGGLNTSGSNRARIARLEPLLRRLAGEQGKDPMVVFTAAVCRFKSDANIRAKRLGLGVFLDQFDLWCAPDAVPPRTVGEIRAEQGAADLARMKREQAEAEENRIPANEIRALTAGIGRKIAP